MTVRLSFTKLSKYEACPLSYKLYYLDKHRSEQTGVPLLFGKAVHEVPEVLVREHMEEERVGRLSEDRATELWKLVWEDSGLTGLSLFWEGLTLVQHFVRDQGELDHTDVLAVEKKFKLNIGGFEVIGYLDRVDRVDDETIEIVDYKTNRLLFTRSEVEASLQLSLYDLAARTLWPWVKNVRLSYWMLRHRARQSAEHTDEKREATQLYVETLGKQIETATEFPARLNSNCVYCDQKKLCPAYAEALKGEREFICEDMDDLEAVAKEREEVASLAKILYARKGKLETIIKTALKEQDELVLGGIRYQMAKRTTVEYPFEPALKVLEKTTALPRDELLTKVGAINNKAAEKLVKEAGKDRAHARLLKLELESVAKKQVSPWLSAKAAS